LFVPPLPGTKEAHVEVTTLLLAGDRVGAAKLAMSSGLWAHALIIASYANKDTYNEVIMAYSAHSIGEGDPVRTIFDLFGGKTGQPQLFDAQKPILAQRWRSNLQVILSNRTPGDTVALTKLGLYLLEHQLVGPAHLWYVFIDNMLWPHKFTFFA
jgi:hypothetical protein